MCYRYKKHEMVSLVSQQKDEQCDCSRLVGDLHGPHANRGRVPLLLQLALGAATGVDSPQEIIDVYQSSSACQVLNCSKKTAHK